MKKKKINSWLPKLTCQISLPTIQKTRPNLQRAILLKKTPTSLALNLNLNDITFQTLYFLKTQNTGGNYFFIFIKNKNQVNFFKLIVQIICKKVSSTQFSSISTQFWWCLTTLISIVMMKMRVTKIRNCKKFVIVCYDLVCD